MMQQQFFSLSPMAGQESFGNPLDVRPTMLAQTPTTSSMLAALQADTFGGVLGDPTATTFGADSFAPLSYLDPSPVGGPGDDPLAVGAGLSFPDYVNVSGTSAFDPAAFTTQDLGISASGTPPSTSNSASEPASSTGADNGAVSDSEAVKSET